MFDFPHQFDQLNIYLEQNQFNEAYRYFCLILTEIQRDSQGFTRENFKSLFSWAHTIAEHVNALSPPISVETLYKSVIEASKPLKLWDEETEVVVDFYLKQGDHYYQNKKYSDALVAYYVGLNWKLKKGKGTEMPDRSGFPAALSRLDARIWYETIKSNYDAWFSLGFHPDRIQMVSHLTQYGIQEYGDEFITFYEKVLHDTASVLKSQNDRYKQLIDSVLPFLNVLKRKQNNQAALDACLALIRNAPRDFDIQQLTDLATQLTNKIQHSEAITIADSHSEPPLYRWQVYGKPLHELRQTLNREENFRLGQQRFTQSIGELMGGMIKSITDLLGPPPCGYQLIGLGSFARREMNSRSDIDLALLVEEEEYRLHLYFRNLLDLLKHSVDMLGEREDISPGFRIDNGCFSHLCGECDNIQTPRGLVSLVYVDPARIDQFQPESCALHRSVPIYPIDDGTLNAEYQYLLWKKLTQTQGAEKHHQRLGRLYVTEHQRQRSEALPINLKEKYLNSLTYLVSDLALFYGIASYDREEVLNELEKRKIIDARLKIDLMNALDYLHRLRFKLHEYYAREKEDICPEAGEDGCYVLNGEEARTLKEINNFIESCYRHIPQRLEPSMSFLPHPQLEDARSIFLMNFSQDLRDFTVSLRVLLGQSLEASIENYDRLQERLRIIRARFAALKEHHFWTESKSANYDQLFKELRSLLKQVTFHWQSTEQGPRTWCALSESQLERGKKWVEQADQLFQEEQKTLDGFQRAAAVLIKPILEDLGANLFRHQASMGEICDYYQLCPECWRPLFWIILRESTPPGRLPAIYFALDHYPSPDGYRPSLDDRQVEFEKHLHDLVQQEPFTSGNTRLICPLWRMPEKTVQGNLVESVAQQLGDIEKRLKEKRAGREATNHLVLRIEIKDRGYYLKFYPEIPGFELAVSQLHRRLMGYGTSRSLLAKLILNGRHYPVLISEEVKGMPLDKVLEPDLRLDPKRYSQLALMSLFILPEDGKPHNFILNRESEPEGREVVSLVSVDNDHAFGPPIIEEGLLFKTQRVMMKTIVFCFDEATMPLDQGAVEEFLQLNPKCVLDQWIADLRQYGAQLEAVFSSAECESLSQVPIVADYYHQMSFTPIRLPPQLVSQLYQKISMLQRLLRRHSELTPLELLDNLDARLGRYYRNLLTTRKTPRERFNQIAARYYDHGCTLTRAGEILTLTFGSSLQVAELIRQDRYRLEANQEELDQIAWQFSHFQEVKARVETGDWQILLGILPYFRIRIINRLDWQAIPEDVRPQILQLLSSPDLAAVTTRLRICNCSALVSSRGFGFFSSGYLLGDILAGKVNLQKLRIENCQSLEKIVLPSLPFLKTLEIIRCDQVKAIRLEDVETQLPRLTYVDISGCGQMVLDTLCRLQNQLNQIRIVVKGDILLEEIYSPDWPKEATLSWLIRYRTFLAARIGNVDIMGRLIAAGANVNERDEQGKTLLWVAARHGHSDMVTYLIAREGINVTEKDKETCSWMANYVSQAVVGRAYYQPFPPPLWLAAERGDITAVNRLLAEGVDVDEVCDSAHHVSPLWIAAANGKQDVVQRLIRAGANITQATDYGTTPYEIAVRKGHNEIAQYLKTVNTTAFLRQLSSSLEYLDQGLRSQRLREKEKTLEELYAQLRLQDQAIRELYERLESQNRLIEYFTLTNNSQLQRDVLARHR